jgi:hypothetical protein
MSDFSIDMAISRIYDARIRTYFAEVYSSYVNRNYRSAVVMLWSVVICDLLFKMHDLSIAFNDETAKAILKTIAELQEKNPKSSEWEQTLFKEVKTKTQLLNEGEYASLELLQKHRHLSAHPVLTGHEALFAPTKDQSRSHLRNALDAVLTKPPIMTKKVIDFMVADLESKKNLFPDDESLDRYLKAMYLSHSAGPVSDIVFRSIWKLVFKCKSQECHQNREINYRALCVFYRHRQGELDRYIESNALQFSDVVFKGNQIELLLDFLSKYPNVYSRLTLAAREIIRNIVKEDTDLFALAWYLSESVENHLGELRNRISQSECLTLGDVFAKVLEVASNEGLSDLAIDMAIDMFGQSHSFSVADARYQRFIRHYLGRFEMRHFIKLVEKIEGNSQILNRKRATLEHRKIAQAIANLADDSFDYSCYPRFSAQVKTLDDDTIGS